MQRASISICFLVSLAIPLSASAQGPEKLGGKFKWGMSSEDVLRIIAEQAHAKWADAIAKEPDAYKQDGLRRQEQDEAQRQRESLVKFDGATTANKSWGASLVQAEFAQHNDESMLVVGEARLRRFLFFWHDKLYKQLIALDAEHPSVLGKTFDDFARVLQERYGQAEIKFSPLRTKDDDMKVDHLEWPADGEYQLYAVDQSDFYGNFCLVLFSPKVAQQVEAHRSTRNASPQFNRNALVDSVTTPSTSTADRNEEIVDRIISGHK